MKITITFLWLLLSSQVAFAIPIVVSNQQAITVAGQLFNFNFTGLPTIGANGQFNITVNGDYSGANSESAVTSLDVASGLLDLGNHNLPNAIISNTITGLTFASYSRIVFESDDIQHSWVFNISDSLLANILMDGTLSVQIKNDVGVNPLSRVNPDFVRAGYRFDTIELVAAEPRGLWLFFLGLASLAAMRFNANRLSRRKLIR